MAIDVTEAAANKVKGEIEWFLKKRKAEDPNFNKEIFLRFGVKGGGCSGLSYILELDAEVEKHDKIFPNEKMLAEGKGADWGFKIVVDAKSYLYLNGTAIDYVFHGLEAGFVFKNPNAKSGCGCGTSFSPE
ncbi:MAG: hypothetical protein A3G49_01130 [Candidatus Sungbacteria bacterium RIFCSPLOWO2_12_FULL_41_11]|uniref:Core domain-containing protein n=1 Tax=Candidatus Sungbacteria bacterium RIFCSPLOWO2_12_FULL_41_11 TaxID=1802286 RepID=A0A1G2LP81_9BACT|nr:MAG: HesB family protein [Parcubacteria group bacterium GW2011_GWA2_42_14]OGZ97425.1 MAG: hypothetical protein A3D41_05680 [Candidatus Sungbacteria bacterium RIFCSPHIGHO2_02_FULL_41_12b]OHA13425.1 MAG: hypothetical protein A3G49_01130 [Candidatus Sungbacteria bacterium RIFCSPLOWO2_12_FULL_41_11]